MKLAGESGQPLRFSLWMALAGMTLICTVLTLVHYFGPRGLVVAVPVLGAALSIVGASTKLDPLSVIGTIVLLASFFLLYLL